MVGPFTGSMKLPQALNVEKPLFEVICRSYQNEGWMDEPIER